MNTLTSWFHYKITLFTGFITNFHFSHLGFKKNSENRILGGKLKQTLGKKKGLSSGVFLIFGKFTFFLVSFREFGHFLAKIHPKNLSFLANISEILKPLGFFSHKFQTLGIIFWFFFVLQWKIHINFFEHFFMKLLRLK